MKLIIQFLHFFAKNITEEDGFTLVMMSLLALLGHMLWQENQGHGVSVSLNHFSNI